MKLTKDWICGFVEGEGTFCVSITQTLTKKEGSKQVRLYFKVTQHKKNIQVLYALKAFFGVGLVKPQTKDDSVWEFSISRFEHLDKIIIPFFVANTLHTSKKFDFLRFRKVALLMNRGEHLTEDGLAMIEKIRHRMNTTVCIIEEE